MPEIIHAAGVWGIKNDHRNMILWGKRCIGGKAVIGAKLTVKLVDVSHVWLVCSLHGVKSNFFGSLSQSLLYFGKKRELWVHDDL